MKNNLLYPLLVANVAATTTIDCGGKTEGREGCGVLTETLQKLNPDEVDWKRLCDETFYQVRICLRQNGFCPEDKN